jgi:MFS family permease
MPDSANPTAPAGNSWKELLGLRYLGILTVLCFGVWLHAADSLLVATLMPSAVLDIGGVAYLSWTLALYELASIVAAAATGLFVMRAGLRNLFVAAALIYTGGCALSAVAPDMAVMLAGRMLQGIGGGMMLAGTFVGMNRLFPAHLWIKVVAAVSAVWGMSALVGPLIGGLFASWGIWRGGFWAFGVQSMLLGIAVLFILSKDHRGDDNPSQTVPWIRLGLLSLAVVAISAAGAHVTAVTTPLLCAAGIAAAVLLLRRDNRSTNRIFAPRPWNINHAPGAGSVMVLTSALATISFTIYGPILMQVLYGADPLTAGYYIAAESVAWSVAALAVSGVREHCEKSVILVGSALMTIGIVGFAVVMPLGPMPALLPFALCQGAGFGMAWGFVVRRTIAAAPEAERDRISSSLPTVQMIGYAFGAAIAGIVANGAGFAHGLSIDAAREVGIWVFAAFVPLALIGNIAAWKLANARPPRAS